MGADVGWTSMDTSGRLYCRRNGRTFRIEIGKDKRRTLFRINEILDTGELLGSYQRGGDANNALKKIAYSTELPR
ncbi:hypothetical protein RAD16_02460 [Bradyrhizobium sp. 18BD]